MNKTHGSLFSGIGAPELASEWMGWENVFHCEINDFCRSLLDKRFKSTSYADITKTDFNQWKGRIDVLTGGFPCQPFSLSGQRKGAYDNRYLWPEMLRAIREIRPTWVIGENVAGILTMVQPGEETEMGSQTALFGEDNRKRVLLRQEYVVETICKDLEREGYSVQPLLIPACAVGAPTEETECGLLLTGMMLPTPTSIDAGTGRINKSRSPNAREADKYSKKYNPNSQMGTALTAMAVNGMLPTPTASCYNTGTPADRKDGKARKSQLNHLIARRTGHASQLNPLFVEEMMGFPLMWTTLPFLSQNGDRNQSKDMEMP